MERQVTVVNQSTNSRNVVTVSNVNTLAELKSSLANQGVVIPDGFDVFEGVSNTKLVSNDSVLPSNVMFKGAPTNNLVILLVKSGKKIASGAVSRQDLYAAIKRAGLEQVVKSVTGKNYTMVSNAKLEEIINNHAVGHTHSNVPEATDAPEAVAEKCCTTNEELSAIKHELGQVKNALNTLTHELYMQDFIGEDTSETITALLFSSVVVSSEKSSFDDSDIREMMSKLG